MNVRVAAAVAAKRKPFRPLIVVLPILLASCGTNPPLREMACASAIAPTIVTSPDGKSKSTTLRVLTFNIEGLGFPARKGREVQLAQIGAQLSAMRAKGTGPDVVMFQEMFSGAAKNAVAASGYPAITSGPRRTTKSSQPKPDKLPGKAKAKHGELGMHFAGSGIAIASNYPFITSDLHPYGTRACAGLDCLANKGIMFAQISIPGVPTPVDLYNTHMNSRGASKAPKNRNTAAHDRQAQEASLFIDNTHNDAYPVIFGGDFNMRRSAQRWENFTKYQSLSLVHKVCADKSSGCDVQMSWDGDEPWMDTQDLQFFWSGDKVSIKPIRVEALFDGRPDSPQLSDHDGFMVTYRIEWPESLPYLPPSC